MHPSPHVSFIRWWFVDANRGYVVWFISCLGEVMLSCILRLELVVGGGFGGFGGFGDCFVNAAANLTY